MQVLGRLVVVFGDPLATVLTRIKSSALLYLKWATLYAE